VQRDEEGVDGGQVDGGSIEREGGKGKTPVGEVGEGAGRRVRKWEWEDGCG